MSIVLNFKRTIKVINPFLKVHILENFWRQVISKSPLIKILYKMAIQFFKSI